MTEMTEQERADQQATRELARWLGPVTNLQDTEAAAAKFIAWLRANHWRYVAPPPGWKPEPPNPDAAKRGSDLTRDLLNIRKDPTNAE